MKIKLILLCLIVIALNLIGDVAKTTKAQINNVTEYKANKTYYVDLNSDGKKEKILYKTKIIDEYGECEASLKINDIDYSKLINLWSPLEDKFFIVDANSEDKTKEVIVSTYGMSSDLESQWFYFDGKNLKNIGNSSMIPNSKGYFGAAIKEEMMSFKDNKIYIYNRTDILETTFIKVTYELKNHKLVKINKKLYSTPTFREGLLSSEIDLYVHKDRNSKSKLIKIPMNKNFNSTITDDKEWVNIIYNKKEYWLHIKDFKLVDNNNKYPFEVMNNLFQAD